MTHNEIVSTVFYRQACAFFDHQNVEGGERERGAGALFLDDKKTLAIAPF